MMQFQKKMDTKMQKENKVKPEKGRSRLIKDRTGLKKKYILEIEKKK